MSFNYFYKTERKELHLLKVKNYLRHIQHYVLFNLVISLRKDTKFVSVTKVDIVARQCTYYQQTYAFFFYTLHY